MINNYEDSIVVMDDNTMFYHNLDGPAIIFIKPIKIEHHEYCKVGSYNAGDLLYYINDEFLGLNLSNEEFKRLKNIILKKIIFA